MSGQDVVEAVRALAPAVAERAAETERLGRLPDTTVKELADAGLFRLTRPRAHGGLAADPACFYEALRELGHACGSTGWTSGVLGVNAWLVAQFAPPAQEEVWGASPGALVCSSLAPVGKVVPAGDGFRLTGHWSFSSGCEHADWAVLGGMVPRDDAPAALWYFLLPRTDIRVDPVWSAVGLGGTGSQDLLVDDVHVPARRALALAALHAPVRPGHAANPEPLYRLPMGPVLTTSLAAPVVGMAEAAYDAFLTAARARVRFGDARAAEDPFTQVRVGRAASDIDAARLQLARNIDDLYACAVRGEQPPTALRTRLRRDQVRATERAVYAVDLLMESSGGGALRTGDGTLQRAWRDIRTARGHVANDPERALALFGADALGLDVRDLML